LIADDDTGNDDEDAILAEADLIIRTAAILALVRWPGYELL
jgi:hypothetical protein